MEQVYSNIRNKHKSQLRVQ